MADAKDDGKDGIDVADLIIPRVTLSQGISPQVMAGQCENGHFWHTVLEIDLGPELTLVPLLYRKQYTLWNPLHAGGGVLARASDGKHWDNDFSVDVAPYKDMPKKLVKYSAKAGDAVGREIGLGKWGSADPDNEDSGPAATLSHIFLFRCLEHPEIGPFVIFLQRSAEGIARQLLTKVQMDKAPMFGQVYLMGKKTESNSAGQEYNAYTFTKNGYVGSEELYREFEKDHEVYKATRFRTNDDDAQADDVSGGPAGGAVAPDSKDQGY